eukprot:COSAG05_NODE_801_length_7224_cov_4.552000_3_plen_68_part_00
MASRSRLGLLHLQLLRANRGRVAQQVADLLTVDLQQRHLDGVVDAVAGAGLGELEELLERRVVDTCV